MQVLRSVVIARFRRDLLAKVEAFASDILDDFQRRNVSKDKLKWDFYYYVDIFAAGVFDLVSWEQINPTDLRYMPAIKQLFVQATGAARRTISTDGPRDSELDRGRGRRTFTETCTAELAAAILPRLEGILQRWAISFSESDKITERNLTDDEVHRLTGRMNSSRHTKLG